VNATPRRRLKWLVCVALGAAVGIVFAASLRCGFTNFDDPDYVTQNTDIQHGLTWHSVEWAFTTGHASNWHPLTWLSHIVDCQLYGLAPMGHHLTSVLLHLANSVLLFLLFYRMTGALGRSAFVAAVFALHPLRAESVVWVAERKDVLSTFFWMLSVLAYVRYAENFKSQISNFKWFYALSVFCFALGLMAKQMLVTLPLVLLLLDYWPLGRTNLGWRLLLEKVPFFALSACAAEITFLVQYRMGVVASFVKFPLTFRLANIPVAYARYLGKIFWPSNLAVFYEVQNWKSYEIAGALLLLAGITAWALWRRRTQPYLAVGWFWFLGMLVPTIGLVQVGNQSMADRYSYLPSVGIALMAAWWACNLAARRPLALKLLGAGGVLAIAALAVLTRAQIQYWRTPVTLFSRAAEISEQSPWTCYSVGRAVMEQGNFVRAQRCFERALRVAGDDDSFPIIPFKQGARAGVTASFRSDVHNDLGCALLAQGQVTNAVVHFEKALALKPAFPQAYFNMGRAFMTNSQPDVAADCFQKALALDSNAMAIHLSLADALLEMRRFAEAIPHYRQASRHSHERNPAILGALAASYAGIGDYPDAAATARRGRQAALEQTNEVLARVLDSQARNYEKGLHP
jgi:tetratricopeptide (TPR) repeat protein